MSVPTSALPTTLEENHALILRLLEDNQVLKHELSNLKRMLFGQKSERFIPVASSAPVEQTQLFTEELPSVGFAETKEKISYERRKRVQGHGRNPIPEGIHTEEIVLEPSDEQKRCSCGQEKICIGHDSTTELEYKPAVFYAKRYLRPKYVCSKCPEKGIATASLPARPIERGVAGVSLISWVIISKYLDGLPLYRIESIFKRYSIHINRSSMVGWIEQVCRYLQNIVDAMQADLLESHLMQADETPLKVLDKGTKGKAHLGYLFPYVGDGRIAVFDYQKGRGRTGPSDMLRDYKGKYLMTDGYAGYREVVEKKELIHLVCWAHARRNFFEAKTTEPQLAEAFLALIGKLYDVERIAKDKNLTGSDRCGLRNQESARVLEEIRSLLQNPGKPILPRSPMGLAIAYAMNHWTKLNNYLLDGEQPIDNNLVERLIRIVAIARKNFLFCGSHEGAERAAIIYSLIATCKLNDIEPFEYLSDILVRVADHPQNKIHELTPIAWKAARESA